jgi:3-methyladenine DNA glycosylase Tag
MVEGKWPAFEDAFLGFDPARVAAMTPDAYDRLMSDTRLIRHGPKMASVQANAAALLDIAREAGGFGKWIGGWPVDDTVGLWAAMGKRFKQLGGNSTPYFLRMVGRDTFVLTDDVVKALVAAGVVDRKPTSKSALAATQAAFNAWAQETGRPLCQLSRMMALSIG